VGEVRLLGLMCGIELVTDRATRTPFPPGARVGYQLCLRLREHGFYARPLGDVIALVLPLTVTGDELDRLAAAVHAVLVERFGG
jgi:lysine--8-amino-7-oxononanoate aminotransferase